MSKIIPEDIRAEVLRRFPVVDHKIALEILAVFDGSRLMRCAVHFSDGDLEKLGHALDIAREDYRDLIFWTEYDKSEKQIWDFNKPFLEAKISE